MPPNQFDGMSVDTALNCGPTAPLNPNEFAFGPVTPTCTEAKMTEAAKAGSGGMGSGQAGRSAGAGIWIGQYNNAVRIHHAEA
jgi:hypothetical protein